MKKIKIFFALILSVLLLLNPVFNVYGQVSDTNQIKYEGGEASADGVKISKTISKSNLENYFDITLTVETTSKIEEITKAQDLAVVLVMDISNTMNKGIASDKDGAANSRLGVAKKSVNEFISTFYDYSKGSNAVRQIGLVTFNRDSHDVFGGLQDVNTVPESTLTGENGKVNKITAPTEVDIKWTNMEAGLKRANSLLATSKVKNKYIIFLTDGLPTTYIKSGYQGYIPLKSDHTKYSEHREGNFYNYEKNVPIGNKEWSGTNYSDLGARKAEELAYKIKNNGIKIYSIGVGITGQYPMWHLQHNDNGSHADTVDTDTEARNYAYYSNNGYKIPRYYAVLPGVNVPSKNANTDVSVKNKYNDTSYYKTWLSEYIGSDALGTSKTNRKYYYDSDNKEALENAYKKIFEDIKEMTDQEINASWVAEDPMNVSGKTKNIQFVGLYDDNMNLKDRLNNANNGESDTASYNETKDAISWDLKASSRTEIKKQENGKELTYYKYEIKYKIRLENEISGFVEKADYNTNGKTYLDYVVIENVNGVNVRSEKRSLDFPIPKVFGYLGTLTFDKLTNYGNKNKPLEGTTFEIYHSSDCPCLKERKHIDENFKMTSTSNSEGKVIFDNIPSGHKYKIHEISTDEYHEINTESFDVTVSYGQTTSPLKDNKIINNYKTKDLTISKTVKGDNSKRSFTFIIEATYKDEKLEGKYKATRINGNKTTNEEVEFIGGKITIKLKDNERFTIEKLPYLINFKITETDNKGFIVKYKVNDEETIIYNEKDIKSRSLDTDTIVKFTNISSYELPATGSSGMLILLIMGSLLLVIPVIYISVNILNRKLTIKE